MSGPKTAGPHVSDADYLNSLTDEYTLRWQQLGKLLGWVLQSRQRDLVAVFETDESTYTTIRMDGKMRDTILKAIEDSYFAGQNSRLLQAAE